MANTTRPTESFAWQLIQDPNNFCDVLARDSEGNKVPTRSPQAVKWDLMGAIAKVHNRLTPQEMNRLRMAVMMVTRKTQHPSFVTDHKQAVQVLKKAGL